MMNIKEGMVGLPDVPGYGIWGRKLPDCIKDWEILPIPVEDVKRGACNAAAVGDGRVIIDSSCTETMKQMEKRGITPVPVDYQTCWSTFNSGIDCTDCEMHRENE